MLDAVLGSVHVRAVLRFDVRRVESLEPFAALEWGSGIGRVAYVTLDRKC